jgi:hypothetical protein
MSQRRRRAAAPCLDCLVRERTNCLALSFQQTFPVSVLIVILAAQQVRTIGGHHMQDPTLASLGYATCFRPPSTNGVKSAPLVASVVSDSPPADLRGLAIK